MGRDLFDESEAARAVYETADRVLGYELSRICFEGPDETLRETLHTQPAVMATSLAALAAAVETGAVVNRPAIMAGHSIGEFSALVAAGAMSLEDGLRLVSERARLMTHASKRNPGTLAAVLGLDEQTVDSICAETGTEICNLNLPTQTVIGGTHEAIERAINAAKARGGKAMELAVSGAFHSSLMAPAIEGMSAIARSATIVVPAVPVVANLTAHVFESASAIRDEVSVQLARSIHWHESVAYLASRSVTKLIEFGPGRVLTGMAKRLVPGLELQNVGGMSDLDSGRGDSRPMVLRR